MTFILRDYQEEAIARVMASYKENPSGSELLVLATGAGKTVIFSEIIRLLAGQGVLTLMLAHRDDLLDQAIDKYHAVKPTAIVGKVKGPICQLGGEYTVASVASACKPKRIKMLQAFNYGLIVVDEAHHAAATSYQSILKAFPRAFVLYVTATEDRLDGKKIIEKPALLVKSLVELVKEKYLCPPRAIAIKTETDLNEVKTTAGDFNEKELSEAVDTPARNKLIVDSYQKHAPNMPFIGFAVTVAHAKSLAYTFQDAGIECGVITGDTPAEERQRLYAAVAAGEIAGLWSVQVLTEGFDLPCIACIIMARPTKSRSLYVQCVGRGARLYPGKEYFLILDITDNCLRHRLMPHSINSAFGLALQNNESIEEAEERAAREEEEERKKQKQIRRLKDKRKEDLAIDLLQAFDWKKREADGSFILASVGTQKHRMALRPEGDMWDVPEYSVWASLAPDYRPQQWAGAMPLTDALQFAEARILKLIAEPAKAVLFDLNHPWRSKPIDPLSPQVENATRLGICFWEGMTKGQLSDLIDEEYSKRAERRKAKKSTYNKERYAVSAK
jgi:superfamily II DNA or RNA helicase